MKIATWNINGIKARIDLVPKWLAEAEPDIVCLQEIKSIDENFPTALFEDLGYNVAVHGQKSFNGVALLSKYPLEDIRRGLPGDDGDEQARYIEASVSSPEATIRVAGIYLPNGNPAEGPKFDYKLGWMDRLESHAAAVLTNEEPFILAGDYNVIPADGDCYDPAAWEGDALTRPESRARFRRLVNLGFTEAWRALHDETNRAAFDAGVYGVPTYLVEDEMWFGREHLPRVAWILGGRKGPPPDVANRSFAS